VHLALSQFPTAARGAGDPLPSGRLDEDLMPRVAVALPSLILAAVAAIQMVLSLTMGLSPWKGGGFGMFASTDGLPFRDVRVFVSAPARSEEVLIPPSLARAAAAAVTFPRPQALETLARGIADRERRYGRDVETVRVEVSRTVFSPTLEVTRAPLRTLTVHVDPAAPASAAAPVR
jgi:hypothetical protein